MKKITRIAALLAAGALLFGAVGCSSGGDGDAPPRGTTPVSYALKTGTPGFDSGSLEVSGMDTTEDTGDDTFKMTLKPNGEDAKTVTGTWELTDTGFVCKSDADVTIGEITVNAGESVSGELNEDNSEITLTVAEGVSLVFVKDEDSGGITSTVVDAVWDFATQPTGFQTDDTNALTAFKLSPTSGSGATLTATGRWKWATAYLQSNNSSGKTVSEATGWTSTSSGKFLTLTLEGDASVTVEYAGAGALANSRWVAILDGDNTVKFSTSADGIANEPKDTKTIPLTKGTYTIATNGARIYSVTCAQEKKDPAPGDTEDGEGDKSDDNSGTATPGSGDGEDGEGDKSDDNPGTVTPDTPGSGGGEGGDEEGDGDGKEPEETEGATTASFLVPDTASTEEIAAGGTVKDTGLFTITTEGKLIYSIGTSESAGVGSSSNPVTFTLLDGTSKTFKQGLKQGDNTAPDGTTETKKILIKAKEAVTLRAYVTLANDSYNSHRPGKIYYAVDSKEAEPVAVAKRTDATVIEASLAKGETLAIYATIDESEKTGNTGKLWFFGAEAEKE